MMPTAPPPSPPPAILTLAVRSFGIHLPRANDGTQAGLLNKLGGELLAELFWP